MPAAPYVIVGASLAGLTAAETLRKGGYDGRLVIVGDEDVLPYDRPPLSKQVIRGDWEPAQAFLRDDAHHAGLDLDWRLGRRAVALDLAQRQVILDGDEPVSYEGLVIATGVRARRLPGPELAGVHVLRTMADAVALRAELDQSPRVCVVGAGFIGTEVAAVCRARGLEVTIVATTSAPLANMLPPELAATTTALHLDHGVELRCGTKVAGLEGRDRVEAVLLEGGERVPADLVVVGIGAEPETEWLASSGLEIGDGVICDATLAASAPGVVAAGDVARWPHPLFGETMRVEHWTNALDQGAAAARRLLHGADGTPPFGPVPYVWSDQYDTMIQIMGRIKPGDDVRLVQGSYEAGKFVAVTGRAGCVVGALAFNEPRALRAWRAVIAAKTSWTDA
jgi:NADPH-dependent 2,4-dienoyl-CoA reductase/sulfur reductase-like enzyme